jgi:hypothetical protein
MNLILPPPSIGVLGFSVLQQQCPPCHFIPPMTYDRKHLNGSSPASYPLAPAHDTRDVMLNTIPA